MITAIKIITNPIAIALFGLVASVGAYEGGKFIGHRSGVEAQKAAQTAADVKASEEIRERVRDALDQIGADSDDADVDSILRGLAGDTDGDD